MDWLIQKLLHVRPANWASGGDLGIEFLSLPRHDIALIWVIAGALGAWGVWWLYKREGRTISTPVRIVLASLRLIVLAMVLFMLFEPVLVFRRNEYFKSNLLVLKDVSDSMGLRDGYADATEANRLATMLALPGQAGQLRQMTREQLADHVLRNGLIKRLAGDDERNVRINEFTAQVLSKPATTSPATTRSNVDRSSTAIGAAIRQAIASQQGQPIAGVLLLSDGESNSGEAPAKAAEYAKAEGVPIVSIAMGTPEGPQNAKINKIDVSPVVFVRDPNPLRVLVESRGMSKRSATVVLDRSRDGGPWEEIGRQAIALEESGRIQAIPFEFKEENPARLRMRAHLEEVGPELSTDDNIAMADVRAIHQRIRVLFIAGETFPEVEFIRNAILRDASLSASTWLQTADPNYDQPGEPRIKRLPTDAEELNEFDCVVLYDPDPSLWPDDFSQMLNDFVTKAGGGLVFVAGERNTKNLFDHLDDPSSQWLSLLPVVIEPGLYQSDVSVKLSSREAWKLDITSDGRSDQIFAFNDKADQNDVIISNLPGMFWHFPVTRAKPGAMVLARHGDPRMRNEHGPHVLLATQLVGPGRSFFVGFDSTYRWRYLDDHYFDGFWARMIDRAGRNKQLGGRYPYTLSVDRTSYRPGSQVTLTARFENAADRDRTIDAMHGEVNSGTESPIPITLSPRAGDPSVFETTFTVEKSGLTSVRVWTGEPDSQGNVSAATLQVLVELPNLEFEQPGQDMASLQTIARISGGDVFSLADANKAADSFKIRKVARTLEDRQEIWDAPLLFGTMLTALFLEWILRKRYRLV